MQKHDSKTDKTTIYDIARELGVSASTVSRALAGSTGIGEKTRQRVVKAAAAANYVPNTLAKNLRNGRTRTIEVMFPLDASGHQKIADPFYLDMLAVVTEALALRDYDVLLTNTPPWSPRARTKPSRVDGMIMIAQGQDMNSMRKFAASYSSLVVWGANMGDGSYLTVGSDNPLGAKLATQHLINLGRKKIAFVGDRAEPEVEQRWQGFSQALTEAGRSPDDAVYCRAPFNSLQARVASQALIASGRDFDAAVCATDVIALHLIDALRRAGRSVPNDVAVVGYDDISMASNFGPQLTTIGQQIAVGGSLLVDTLFTLLEGGNAHSVVITPQLIIRETCGANAHNAYQ